MLIRHCHTQLEENERRQRIKQYKVSYTDANFANYGLTFSDCSRTRTSISSSTSTIARTVILAQYKMLHR